MLKSGITIYILISFLTVGKGQIEADSSSQVTINLEKINIDLHYQTFSSTVFNFLKDLIPKVVAQNNRRVRHNWDNNNRNIKIFYKTLDSLKLGSQEYYQLMPKIYRKEDLGYENRLFTLDTNLIIQKRICNTYFPYNFEIVNSEMDSDIIVSNPYKLAKKEGNNEYYYQVVFNSRNVEYLFYVIKVSYKNWFEDCLSIKIVEENHIMY